MAYGFVPMFDFGPTRRSAANLLFWHGHNAVYPKFWRGHPCGLNKQYARHVMPSLFKHALPVFVFASTYEIIVPHLLSLIVNRGYLPLYSNGTSVPHISAADFARRAATSFTMRGRGQHVAKAPGRTVALGEASIHHVQFTGNSIPSSRSYTRFVT